MEKQGCMEYGVPATYRREAYPRYRGNKLIEAMPSPLDELGTYTQLHWQPPPRDAEFRKLPLHVRLDGLEDLQELFIPLNHHARAFTALMCLIRWGYSYRDPSRPEVMRTIFELINRSHPIGLPRTMESGGGAIGILLWGITGSGKTSFVDRFTRYLADEPILHQDINGLRCRWPQILFLRVQCPPKASLKGLGEAILDEVDRKLGTDHAGGAKKLSQSEILRRVVRICATYLVGLLIIDDVQNLREAHIETISMLNFFCNFMEETGIPLVLCGTYRVKSVMLADPKSASKLTAKGAIEFGRLTDDGDEWRMLVEALWEYNILSEAIPMPKDLPRQMYFHTQGVPRFLREMMTALHERMATEKLSQADTALLDDIAAGPLLKYQESIAVLRRQSLGLLSHDEAAQYEDLLPPIGGLKALKAALEARDPKPPNPSASDVANKSGLRSPQIPRKKTSPEASREPLDDEQNRLIREITSADDPHNKCKELHWIPDSLMNLQIK